MINRGLYFLYKQNSEYDHATSHKDGFTIVELLVVIVVIGVLAAITIVAYSGISNRATISSIQSDLANASTTLKLDYTSNSTFPTTLALANNGKGITPSQSLDNIIYVPDNTSNPNNFCLQYRKGTNNYAVDNISSVSSGVCLQNLVTNGDFRNGTSGWSSTYSSNSVSNNVLSNTGDGTSAQPFAEPSFLTTVNYTHKYYSRFLARVTNSVCSSFLIRYDGTGAGTDKTVFTLLNPIQNQWYALSVIDTPPLDSTGNLRSFLRHLYVDSATASGKVMQVQYVSVIDLTATFGAGNEPTTAQMDTIMSSYPNSWFNIVAKANL